MATLLAIVETVQYYNYKKTLIESFKNKHIQNTQKIREEYRLLFDKLQYDFKNAERENIQKFAMLLQEYSKKNGAIEPNLIAKELNRNVTFGEYQVFLINKDFIIEKTSYKNDLGFNLGQFKSVRDILQSIIEGDKLIDISPLILDSSSMTFKRYLVQKSSDGKYLLQIGYVLDIYKILQTKYSFFKKDTKDLEIILANEQYLQKLSFDSQNLKKQTIEDGWIETTTILKDLFKASHINENRFNELLKSNGKDKTILVNKELNNLFINGKLIEDLDFQNNSFTIYSITDGLFNTNHETKFIVKTTYDTEPLEDEIYKDFLQRVLKILAILLILTISYILMKRNIIDKLYLLIKHIENNEKSQLNDIHIQEVAILNNKYNELFTQLSKEIGLKEELLYENKRFIADTVHQIRTPLTNIMMNNEMIKLIQKDEVTSEYINQINASINMLSNSYEDLAYITSYGTIEYKPSPLSLTRILEKRIRFFATISKVNFKELHFEIEKNLIIEINEIELERIIDNNLSNAIKYGTVHQPITIILMKKENQIIVEFKSYGNPIKNKVDIFEKNYRENESKRGLGLGLNMVKTICKKYDIQYKVVYEEGQNIFHYIFKH